MSIYLRHSKEYGYMWRCSLCNTTWLYSGIDGILRHIKNHWTKKQDCSIIDESEELKKLH